MNEIEDSRVVREELEEQRATLMARIRREETLLHSPVETAADPLELAQTYAANERRSLLLSRSRRELEQVKAALRRLDEGTYGRCISCGAPINPSRLRVLPCADLCIRCQEQQEKADNPRGG